MTSARPPSTPARFYGETDPYTHKELRESSIDWSLVWARKLRATCVSLLLELARERERSRRLEAQIERVIGASRDLSVQMWIERNSDRYGPT